MGPQRGHFHFFITTDTKHIFVYLRPICNHFSVKSLFPGSLPIFLVGFECKLLDKCSVTRPGSPVPSTPERREGLRACYW